MTRAVVTSILPRNAFGAIVGAQNEIEESIRVILPPDLWPVIGEVYEVDGTVETFNGEWGRSYKQITAKTAKRIRTSGLLIRPWLETIPDIGPVRSQNLIDAFGESILDALKRPECLERLARALDSRETATGQKLAARLQAYYLAHKAREDTCIAEADFLLELEKCGVEDRQAAKQMFRLIGSNKAFDKLLKNPYLAAGLLSWRKADHLGLRLLHYAGVANPKHHQDRLAGACDAVWRTLLKRGHTATTAHSFKALLRDKRIPDSAAIEQGISSRRIIEDGTLLRAPGAAYLEACVAEKLLKLAYASRSINLPADIIAHIHAHENPNRPLTGEQRDAVKGILSNKFAILQGGAGTGKTTTMQVLVKCWEALGGNVMLGALSGKATLRLSRSTGKLAQTLARYLVRFEKAEKEYRVTQIPEMFPDVTNKTLIIIDEASMVDLVTMKKLLEHVDSDAHLALVGDVNQLPPVGLGQVYHDLVAVDLNVFRLNITLRQISTDGVDTTNPIIDVAESIRNGKVPSLPKFEKIDTGAFHVDTDMGDVESAVVGVLTYMKSQVNLDDILILTSLRRTSQNISNAMATRKQVEGVTGVRISTQAPWVSAGDPIICTRNRYDEGLMNGQIGHINTLDPFTVRWDGESLGAPVGESAFIDLASAWAITCHRAQGSESRFVIVALDGDDMMTREWLYTAATRAKQQVVFVGPQALIKSSIAKRSTRTTGFITDFLRRRMSYDRTGQNCHRASNF